MARIRRAPLAYLPGRPVAVERLRNRGLHGRHLWELGETGGLVHRRVLWA